MADPNAALAAALTALTAVLTQMQANPHVAPLAVPVIDVFQTTAPFDLSSRTGSHAYTTASAPLDDKWDGTIAKFPFFLIALRVCAAEVNWGTAAPHGILIYAVAGEDKHLFTDHHSITQAILDTACLARTNDRATKNSQALYKYLKSSIEGDLRATLFDQDGNIPAHEDGPVLFEILTSFTMAFSLQLFMMSFQHILEFEPAEHSFNVHVINTKPIHLFVLATMRERTLSEQERIQHTLTVYACIKQPEIWAQYVHNQVEEFETGTLNNCQAFMNAVALKFTKIATSPTGFDGCSSTVQEDIVAMLVAKKKAAVTTDPNDGKIKKVRLAGTDSETKKRPPFLKHFKSSSATDATVFKVGDSKEFNNETWYFCNCPTHRDRIKWHTHTASACRTRKKWLETGGSINPPIAHIANDADSVSHRLNTSTTLATPTGLASGNTSSSDTMDMTNITSLLAAALSLAGNNSAAKEAIANALNAIYDE